MHYFFSHLLAMDIMHLVCWFNIIYYFFCFCKFECVFINNITNIFDRVSSWNKWSQEQLNITSRRINILVDKDYMYNSMNWYLSYLPPQQNYLNEFKIISWILINYLLIFMVSILPRTMWWLNWKSLNNNMIQTRISLNTSCCWYAY